MDLVVHEGIFDQTRDQAGFPGTLVTTYTDAYYRYDNLSACVLAHGSISPVASLEFELKWMIQGNGTGAHISPVAITKVGSLYTEII